MCTDLSFVSFPDHKAALCVNVPDTHVSFIGRCEQNRVHVVAQSREHNIANLRWGFHLLDLQR